MHQHHEDGLRDHQPHEVSAGAERRLLLVLVLTALYIVVQVTGGLLANSLALVADAGHMLTDVLGLAMTLVALRFAHRPATPARTFGFYRAEVLAALANSLLLLGIAGYILFEAWRRFTDPEPVQSGLMLLVAVGGLLVNLGGVWLLHDGASHSLGMQAAFLEVVADLLGSAGAIAAAIVIALTGWSYADLVVSVLIAALIVPRTVRLLRSALDVLLEATPRHIDLHHLEGAMREVPGVTAVHDLHVWTISSGFVAMSGHAEAAGRPSDDVLHDLQATLLTRFGIRHTTLQVEQCEHPGADSCVVDPRCLVIEGTGPAPALVLREEAARAR